MDNKFLKDIFCANCQIVTSHNGEVDGNGEFVFTCQNLLTNAKGEESICERFVKFPADVKKEEFPVLVEAHKDANEGQVSLEKQNEKLADLLGVTLKDVETATPPAETPEAPVEPVTPTE